MYNTVMDKTDKIMVSIINSIKNCIKLTVDRKDFIYHITESTKKINNGSFVLSLRLCSRYDETKIKYLVFIVNKDIRTGLYTINILDGNMNAPSIIFSTSDNYPVHKIEKYVPNIIISTENMIMI